MSGLTVIQTSANAATFGGAWLGFTSAVQSYTSGKGSMDDVVTASTALTSAATAFSEAPGFAAISRGTGYASGMANFQNDLTTYNAAVRDGDTGKQAEAMAGLIADGCTVGGAVAVAASPLVGPAAPAMDAIGAAADILGGVATGAQITIGAANWLTDYVNALNDALLKGAVEQSDEFQINLNDPSGNAEIVMPGQAGDTLVATPLSGSNAFQYVEDNSQGVQTGSITLAMNGTTETEQMSGQGIVSDVNGFQITVASSTSANVNGTNNHISEGSGDSLGVDGGGNLIQLVAGATTTISGTNGAFDSLTGNGEAFGTTAANGQQSGIFLSANSQANVSGTGNGISEKAGDSVGVYGGGNTIDTVAGALTVIGNTGNAFDLVNATGDSFGGAAANGQGTGITLNANSQINVVGSNNGIAEATGDSVGVYGGGNTIDAAVGALTVIGNTGNVFDLVNASGDSFGGAAANGQATGIMMNANSQINVVGSNNGIAEASGATVGVYGGGNTVDAAAGTCTVLGDTNGNADILDVTGDLFGAAASNGQGSGIFLNGNTQATVNGNANDVGMSTGDTLTATGNSDVVNMAASSVVNVSGTQDDLNGSNAIINITGSNEDIYVADAYNTITVTGVNVTVYANNSTAVNFVGAAANNSSDKLIGSNPKGGTGWTQQDATNAVLGSPLPPGTIPFQLPTFTNPDPGTSPPTGTVTVGDPIVVGPAGPPSSTDPVILNLLGGAVQTTALAGSNSYFDMQDNGKQVQTGWMTAGEGMLVYNPGSPDSVSDDAGLVAGFPAMNTLDSNHDGVLNSSDSAWGQLRVLVDAGDGQQGHLLSLSQLGITSINLDAAQENISQNGNTILADSTFTWANGSTGDVAGVALQYNPAATRLGSPAPATDAAFANSQLNQLIAGMAAFSPQSAATSSLRPDEHTHQASWFVAHEHHNWH